MQQISKVMDNRRAYVKRQRAAGIAQMKHYFMCRYSCGQQCDPKRAYDWGVLCAYLKDCQMKGLAADFRRQWLWPSGNKGSIAGLIGVYHDGHELLADQGLLDSLDWV